MKFLNLLLIAAAAHAAAASDWTQFGANPERTFVVKNDHRLNRRSVHKLKLHWKVRLDNTAKELNALTVPLVAADLRVNGKRRTYAFVAGSGDNIFALDARSGAVVWKKHFEVTVTPKQKPDWLCPNALTATPAIDLASNSIYVLDSGGQLHTLNLTDGAENQPARTMTPPFAKTWSLNIDNGVIYTPTSQSCNQVPSGIYALPLHGGEAEHFQAARFGAGIWGRAGVAIGPSGTIFAGTGDGKYHPEQGQFPNSILAVDAKTLQLKSYFTPKNYAYIDKKDLDMGNTTPVVFPYGKKELVATGGKEGVLWLLDAADLGGPDHCTPLYASPLLANPKGSYFGHGFWGALSTWTEKDGTRWLYAPAWGPATPDTKFDITHGNAPDGSVMAFKVTGPDSHPVLTPAWQSLNLAVPTPVTLVNGVAFVLADADYIFQNDAKGGLLTSEFRGSHAGHATLYALDAKTGNVLFSSGSTVTGFAHFSGVAAGDGQVFVVTWDNTVYAFSTK